MSITTTTFRIALTAAALCSAVSAADAKPRRVVILDFDGPRGLADTGRTAVVSLLGAQYDLVATKRWEDARAVAQQRAHGPVTWQKAAKQSGVDAVIEGWIQDEGRHKVLTVSVREASTGTELDSVSVKLGPKGLSDESTRQLQQELDVMLGFVQGEPDASPNAIPTLDPKSYVGAKDQTKHRPRITTEDDDHDEPVEKPRHAKKVEPADEPKPEATKDSEDTEVSKAAEVKAKPPRVATAEEHDDTAINILFGPKSDEAIITGKTTVHTPMPTPRAIISGGVFYGSRSLTIDAEKQAGPQAYAGVPSKGLQLAAAFYPFPATKIDGQLSGIGFSFGISHSAGSTVTFDDLMTVADYTISQSAWNAGVHYRAPLGDMLSIDGEVSYGKSTYIIEDAPQTFEVPDTAYSYLGAGARLDLNVTERASIGFGGRYLYVLDTGDISSVDWYGPGRASGWSIDGNFKIPLPERLYLKGQLQYTYVGIELDGVGTITEAEGAFQTHDATINGSADIGIEF